MPHFNPFINLGIVYSIRLYVCVQLYGTDFEMTSDGYIKKNSIDWAGFHIKYIKRITLGEFF